MIGKEMKEWFTFCNQNHIVSFSDIGLAKPNQEILANIVRVNTNSSDE